MRKITMEAVRAFEMGMNFKKQNMKVWVDGYTVYMSLHGNLIAKTIFTDGDLNTGILQITNAGWSSNTTKERLNGLRGVSIYQKRGEWFLNNKKWDGSWAVILPGGDWKHTEDDHKNDDGMDRLKTIGLVALMGDIFHAGDRKAGNDWKARMLKAGLEGRGLIMPDNWETLSEEDKQARLDGAINELI